MELLQTTMHTKGGSGPFISITLYTNATFHIVDMLMESNEGDKHKDIHVSIGNLQKREECESESTIGATESS